MRGRLETEWDRTAELLALQCNIAAKKQITTSARLNPYRTVREKPKPLTLGMMVDFLEP